jgi:hypothetical protein
VPLRRELPCLCLALRRDRFPHLIFFSERELAADLPIFPSLDEHALGEIEALLCFSQLLLHALETILESVESCSDISRRQCRPSGAEPGDFDRGESDNCCNRDEWSKYLRVHVVCSRSSPQGPVTFTVLSAVAV